jgi:small subunit ribosomal protein S18
MMEEKIEKKETTVQAAPRPSTGYVKPEYKPRPQYGSNQGGSGGSRPDKFAKGGRRKFGNKKNFIFKKRVCFFCKNKDAVVDYKDVGLMKRFVAESGKISPRRFTGTCGKHQKKLTVEIKKARQMALLIFTDKHK